MVFLAVWLAGSGLAVAEENDGWELIYSKDGISGYQKQIPGSELKEFKAEGFVESRMEVIGEILRDIASYPKWMANCKEAIVLKDIDRNTKILYNETSVPWPVPNRGVIISNTTTYDLETGRAVIRFQSIQSPDYSVKPGRVTVPFLEGEFLLEYYGREMTKVTYRHRAEPGGNIAASIANFQTHLFPVTNIKGLRRIVLLKTYRDRGTRCPEYALIEGMVKDPSAVRTIAWNRMSEYFRNREELNRIFADNRLVMKIIDRKASFESIRHLVIDACILLINDRDVRAMYRNRNLRDAVHIEKFYNDRGLAALFVQDGSFIELILKDRDLLRKIMTDRILFAKIVDSNRFAKSISNDPATVDRLVNDDELILKIKNNSALFLSPVDLRKVIQQRLDYYKTHV
jgi:hypothetical protein